LLDNILARDELGALARARAKTQLFKSVNNKLVDDELLKGWIVAKKGKANSRLFKEKSRGTALEDRVWTLLYRMGLPFASGNSGGFLMLQEGEKRVKNQLDVVAIDDELALAIECKTSEKYAKRPQFQDELAKLSGFRERFIRSVNQPGQPWHHGRKRMAVMAFFLENINLSDNDRERARAENVLLFDEGDLEYYEKLVSHLGSAARYQFYADAAPAKAISGLNIVVPAVKTKIGGHNCYTFPVSPEYLLKIAYVSHRARGKASDINAYQRMMSKARLTKVRDYISKDGIFPTNIVLNIEKKFLTFQRVKQESTTQEQDASGVLGWLEIRPAYKSAWVIDGQHRLFAYSGHPRAAASRLSVLAFEGLSPSMQAGLFVDINAKQKSVKPSLLQELDAELHWDAPDPREKIRAIISKSVEVLDSDKGSPLFERVQSSDDQKDATRCISFTALFKAIDQPRLFIAKEGKAGVVQYGPLWAGSSELTLKRATHVVMKWLTTIREGAPDWWDLGAAEGGGLAMNDGVTACLNLLESVVEHLESKGASLIAMDTDDLSSRLQPFARAAASSLGALSAEERKQFRDYRGIQGQTIRTKQLQLRVRTAFPSFNPPGLDDFFRRQSEQTNLRAKEITDKIEILLQSIVIEELKQHFTSGPEAWWWDGVPKPVRLPVSARAEADDMRRGSREAYFDLMDYRKIAQDHWVIFQSILGFGKGNSSKEKQTKWMVEVNDARNIVAHPSSGRTVAIEELARLASYHAWLQGQRAGVHDDAPVDEPDDEADAA
jgi:DNA sulfur modification protein DndB